MTSNGRTRVGTRHGVLAPALQQPPRDRHRNPVGRVTWEDAAACGDLPLSVAERYFGASAVQQPFEHATARMICHGCPVKVACLATAIATPGAPHTRQTRGGESPAAQKQYRHEYLTSREHPLRIAQRVIDHQLPPLRGAYGSPGLRSGDFPSPRPLR